MSIQHLNKDVIGCFTSAIVELSTAKNYERSIHANMIDSAKAAVKNFRNDGDFSKSHTKHQLATFLANSNIAAFRDKYPHYEDKVTSVEFTIEDFLGEEFKTPVTVDGLAYLTAVASRIESNLELESLSSYEQPQFDAIKAFSGTLPKSLIAAQSQYPASSSQLHDIASDILTLSHNGQEQYDAQEALRAVTGRLETIIEVGDNDYRKQLFGNEMLFQVLKSHSEGKMIYPLNGAQTPNFDIPSIQSNVTYHVRLAGDIPEPDADSLVRLSKAIHQAAHALQVAKVGQIFGVDGQALTRNELDIARDQFQDFSDSHDRLASSSLTIYPGETAFSKELKHEKYLTTPSVNLHILASEDAILKSKAPTKMFPGQSSLLSSDAAFGFEDESVLNAVKPHLTGYVHKQVTITPKEFGELRHRGMVQTSPRSVLVRQALIEVDEEYGLNSDDFEPAHKVNAIITACEEKGVALPGSVIGNLEISVERSYGIYPKSLGQEIERDIIANEKKAPASPSVGSDVALDVAPLSMKMRR